MGTLCLSSRFRGKTGVQQKPQCLYSQFRTLLSVLGKMGTLLKSMFPDPSQGPTLQLGLSQENSQAFNVYSLMVIHSFILYIFVLITSGCQNKNSLDGWLIDNRDLFPILGCCQHNKDLVLQTLQGGTLFWVTGCHLLITSSHGGWRAERGSEFCRDSRKGTNSIQEGSTPQRPHKLIPSCYLGSQVSTYEFGRSIVHLICASNAEELRRDFPSRRKDRYISRYIQ